MASSMVQGISDRYWTEHTGTRTGDGVMAHFWDEKEDRSDLDELFSES